MKNKMIYNGFLIISKVVDEKIMYSPESEIYGWMGLYKSIFAAQDAVDTFYLKNKSAIKDIEEFVKAKIVLENKEKP